MVFHLIQMLSCHEIVEIALLTIPDLGRNELQPILITDLIFLGATQINTNKTTHPWKILFTSVQEVVYVSLRNQLWFTCSAVASMTSHFSLLTLLGTFLLFV